MTSAQQLKELLQAAQACTRLDEAARAQDAFFSTIATGAVERMRCSTLMIVRAHRTIIVMSTHHGYRM